MLDLEGGGACVHGDSCGEVVGWYVSISLVISTWRGMIVAGRMGFVIV